MLNGNARAGDTPVLELKNVSISYFTRRGEVSAVRDISFRLMAGESLGLVGESGSGKSTVAFAVMRYLGGAGRVVKGHVLFEGKDINTLSDADVRALRGGRMAMVYQEPMSSLNPVMTVERQLTEVAVLHSDMSAEQAAARALELLKIVRMPQPEQMLKAYPHQISGGQQQRAVIAMALMTNPSLLVLDEPTTALDVRVQAGILDLLIELRRDFNTAFLYISHDLGTVAHVCDMVGVMQGGIMVEQGKCFDVLTNPQHPYTQKLVGARPRIDQPIVARPQNTEMALTVDAVTKTYRQTGTMTPVAQRRVVKALKGIGFAVPTGSTLAIVGESGCGKSTLAKIMLGIEPADGGSIELAGGFELSRMPVGRRPKDVLSKLQMVFQNPDGTLNPSHTIGYALARPLVRLGKARKDVDAEVARLLDAVRLAPEIAQRRPHQLSGGQKQRVAIARALASDPDIVIADEPTSALDVSVQATIIELLRDLQAKRTLTMVFISHDLALVRSFADFIAVIQHGEVVDFGPVEEVFATPHQAYTAELIAAVPRVPERGDMRLSA